MVLPHIQQNPAVCIGVGYADEWSGSPQLNIEFFPEFAAQGRLDVLPQLYFAARKSP